MKENEEQERRPHPLVDRLAVLAGAVGTRAAAVDGLGLLRSSATQAQDRVGHEGQRDHGEDENQEQRSILLCGRHGCATYLRSPPWLVCDVAGFCGAKAGSGSGAKGGGMGPADLRGRRLAGRRDQGGAPGVGRIWERGASSDLRWRGASSGLRCSGREARRVRDWR